MQSPYRCRAIVDGVRMRDAIDLMAWPCFALGKRPQQVSIKYEYRGEFIKVFAMPDGPGIATIWDADILTWAVSQLAEGRDRRLDVSPVLVASGGQILRFLRRGIGRAQYAQLTESLDRLAATEIETSLGATPISPARFRWVECWERAEVGLIITITDWLYTAVIDRRRVIQIDPTYLGLTGGIERWLWRLLRRYASGKSTDWEITLRALHARSGSSARAADFIADLRRIARRRILPGYVMNIVWRGGEEHLLAARSTDLIHRPAAVPVDNGDK
jgi:plasmid replication initiation protein